MDKTSQTKTTAVSQAWWRKLLPTAAIVAFFAVLSFAYFSPAALEGRDLFQNDVAGASGTAQDVRDYYDATGETSYWTNSLFGGMPMYQIAPSYPSLNVLKKIQDFCTLQWPMNLLPSYSWLLFAMLIGFYIFMRSLKQERLMSLLGALMWCFSSYFIILIDAGHIWKLMVLSFVPPTIAGIIHTYNGKYLKGGVLTAFFASLQLMSNHVQMSYYFAFVIVAILLAYLYESIKAKTYKHYIIASLVTLLAAGTSIAINSSNIYHTYEYTQETMRGGSALSEKAGENTTNKTGGLDKDYITAWSYGKAETLTFLVPNLYGGASGYLGNEPSLLEEISNDEIKQIAAGMNQYWGDQPFTSGPVYVGAFVLFLAILALFTIRTPLKWALFGVTLLSLFLGWGHNLMWFSDLFIDHFPLYNKFRTVSSILVIAEFTIPTLAILALVEFIQRPKDFVRSESFGIYTSLGLTLGIALFLALVPGLFFDFMSDEETELFRQHLSDPRILELMSALKNVRASVVSSDAWRSVGVILVSLGLCWAYYKELLNKRIAVVGLTLVTLLDLWTVDKRYLNDERFIDVSLIKAQANPVSDADLKIKEDKDPHYRVLNLSVSPFNDATTSYSHRSIGGYHAAKLGRYQDLIEHQISQKNQQVLNMLDMRYIIARGENDELITQHNPEAMGAAWFVNPEEIKVVNTADEEMEALSSLDLRYQAVAHSEQGIKGGNPTERMPEQATKSGDSISTIAGDSLSLSSPTPEMNAVVKLTDYRPDIAKYEAKTDRERLLVFSEIYYPHGWHLTINGKPAEIKRVNYLLRAVMLPAGEHKLEMSFDPKSVHTTELISYIAQALLAIATIALLVLGIRKK